MEGTDFIQVNKIFNLQVFLLNMGDITGKWMLLFL